MFRNLRQDATLYFQLLYPGQQLTFFLRAKVVLGSRGLLVLVLHRMCNYYKLKHNSRFTRWLLLPVILLGYYLSKVLAKSDVLSSTNIEPGVYLSNRGHIILGARKIGTGTLIHECVTIGMNLMNRGVPEIGRNVWIGPHSLIFGDILIGDGATLLPGSVVTKNLPPGVVVQGNPARIVLHSFDNSDLRRTLATEIGSILDKTKTIAHRDVQ